MANITDQFVTSFSELHINAGTVVTNITETNIQQFFTGGDSTETEVVFGTTTRTAVDAIANIAFVLDSTGTKIYFDVSGTLDLTVNNPDDNSASTGTDEVTSIADLLAIGAVFYSAQVPLVMEIGTLSNEATVIDTPTFGEVYRGKLRGQLDGGQLDAQLYWAPRNFVHSLLRDLAESGTALSVGIKWNSDSTGADSEYVVFNSFVSSFGIDTTFDDVAKVSATLVVDGAEHFAKD